LRAVIVTPAIARLHAVSWAQSEMEGIPSHG
jgi:hypothetical protein